MRLVYRTNFAGMYNDISQVVYFHHPKFAKQPQMKLKDILQNSINTLPLITQLFPNILVFYDDDSFIPFLSDHHEKKDSDQHSEVLSTTIDDFVKKRIDDENEVALAAKKKQATPTAIIKTDEKEENRFCWLVCCSSVFLIDTFKKKVFCSYDLSLAPLIAHMMNDAQVTIGASLKEGAYEGYDKDTAMDLGTAHGHVFLL